MQVSLVLVTMMPFCYSEVSRSYGYIRISLQYRVIQLLYVPDSTMLLHAWSYWELALPYEITVGPLIFPSTLSKYSYLLYGANCLQEKYFDNQAGLGKFTDANG